MAQVRGEIQSKKSGLDHQERSYDDVERNFQEVKPGRIYRISGLHRAASQNGWQGGVPRPVDHLLPPQTCSVLQVLSSLQQEPGMQPFCAEYSKLVRAVQQSHGISPWWPGSKQLTLFACLGAVTQESRVNMVWQQADVGYSQIMSGGLPGSVQSSARRLWRRLPVHKLHRFWGAKTARPSLR